MSTKGKRDVLYLRLGLLRNKNDVRRDLGKFQVLQYVRTLRLRLSAESIFCSEKMKKKEP